MSDDEHSVTYRPHPGTSREKELDVLSNVLNFIFFESKASKKATLPGGPNDANKKSSEGEGFEK